MISFIITPMISRAEAGSPTPLKQGRYGKVALLESNGNNNGDPVREKPGFLGRFSKKPKPISSSSARREIANAVAIGELSNQQLTDFSNGNGSGNPRELAGMVVDIASDYRYERTTRQHALKQQFPDEEALVLSDFFEVIPRELAASMMLAISNPNIARDMTITSGVIDTQQCAIEVATLLPSDVRLDLFREMAKLDKERAYALFRLFVSNWSNRLSDFCGQRFIEASLPEELCEDKIAEVCADFSSLGDMLRQEEPER
jgi:hypothetical protein